MNEWYSLIVKYKQDNNLTWPQFADKLGVNERNLRNKEDSPSLTIITQLRKIFPNELLPEGLKLQQTTFIDENAEKTTNSTSSGKKNDIKEVSIKMNKQKEQPMKNKEQEKDQSTITEEEAKNCWYHMSM